MEKWYLINNNTKPNSIGGFENEAFNDYKQDAFSESLTTDIATDLILYNYDLSSATPFRGIIQGNTADTQLKSMERAVLCPIGLVHSGDYVFFENEYWIVDGRPGNNGIYEKATIKECQYKMRWQKDDFTIIERWANLVSASKYDVGEDGNKVMFLTTNNFTITMPHDDDSMTIEGKRVFIDSREIPERVFKITRNDDVLFLHGEHGGTLSLIADKTELNPETDNQELRICDYKEPTTSLTPSEPVQSNILSVSYKGKPELKIGSNFKKFEGIVQDLSGNELSDIGTWDIDIPTEIQPMVTFEISDNVVKLKVEDNDDAIGKTIQLKFSVGDDSVTLDLKIVNIF